MIKPVIWFLGYPNSFIDGMWQIVLLWNRKTLVCYLSFRVFAVTNAWTKATLGRKKLFQLTIADYEKSR